MKKLAFLILIIVSLTLTSCGTKTETPLANDKAIIFCSNRGQDTSEIDLYMIDPSTKEIAPLDTGFETACLPQWSPDGTQILFATPDNWFLYTIRVDGTKLTQITNFHSNNGDWSPDGSRIVFQSTYQNEPENTPDIYIIDKDGHLEEILDAPEAADYGPRWSPDGKRILFVSELAGESELFTMKADGSDITQITHIGNVLAGSWSPDGSHIAFAAGEKQQSSDLYIIAENGASESVRRLTEDEFINSTPSWSPDGGKIVFYSTHGGNYDLWMINADGTELIQLTNDEFIDVYPVWRP